MHLVNYDAVVLSHAHIDHSANLPNLVRQGYGGNIYSTFATRDLCQIMLPDAAKIQAQDLEYINRKRKKEGKPPWTPLYSKQDAERSTSGGRLAMSGAGGRLCTRAG